MRPKSPGRARSFTRFALGLGGLLSIVGCEPIILEPDLDLGVEVDAIPTPTLGDGWIRDEGPMPDMGIPDLNLPSAPVLAPQAVHFGSVEPYTTARRSVELRAGHDPMYIETVSVGGAGFALDRDAPRLPIALDPYETARWTVEFTAEIAGRRSVGELVITAGDGIRRVPLAGTGAWSGPACAAWSIEAEPAPPRFVSVGTPLLLKAKPPSTVSLGDVGLGWTIVEAPLPPERVPLERFTDHATPAAGGPPDDPRSFAAVLLADKPGRYAFVATPILPPEAECVPQTAAIAVHACPCPDRPLHVRIGWQRSVDAPPGWPRIVPLMVSGSAGAWDDGLRPGVHRLDWGRPGPLDDPRLDIVAGDTSGRIDIWIDRGRIESFLRLGLGLFNAPGSPRTAIDISVEIFAGRDALASYALFGVESGAAFWDVAAILGDPSSARVLGYDRPLEAAPDALPDLDAPLALGSPCDPWFGPLCEPQTRCRDAAEGARCRR